MTKENETLKSIDDKKTDKDPKGQDQKSDSKKTKKDPKSMDKDITVENENLRKQITVLQKKIEEKDDFQTRLAEAITGEKPESEIKLEDLAQQVEELKRASALKDQEIVKNALIDELDISEARRKYLKEKIKPSETMAEDIKGELQALDDIVGSEIESSKVSDTRPKGAGASVIPTSFSDIAKDPKAYLRKHGVQ